MKIILLKDVQKIGKRGDIKEVSDGYAKNLLIPQKLAAVATANILNKIEKETKEAEKKAQEELAKLKEMADKLNGFEVKVPLKMGEDGKPFGSITVIKIVSALKKAGFDIEKSQVDLEENIKSMGVRDVKLKFGHNIETTIKVSAEAEK